MSGLQIPIVQKYSVILNNDVNNDTYSFFVVAKFAIFLWSADPNWTPGMIFVTDPIFIQELLNAV